MKIEVETLTNKKVTLVFKNANDKIFFDDKGNMYQIMDKDKDELFDINGVYYCIDKSNQEFENKKFISLK